MLTRFDEKIFFIRNLLRYIIVSFSLSMISMITSYFSAVYGVNFFLGFNIRELLIQMNQINNIFFVFCGLNVANIFEDVSNLYCGYMWIDWYENLKSRFEKIFNISCEILMRGNRLDRCNSFLYSSKTEGLLE